jgi:hypothetical protein
VPETVIGGVSLYTKERGKNTDIFDVALTAEGIEIRRPSEEARFLSWDRITEWEIEQRRGGVLLVLRGGGSVTPLTIPRWKVDDLDLVLRDVTTQWSQTAAARAAGNGVQLLPATEEEAALAHEFEAEPAPVVVRPDPVAVTPEPVFEREAGAAQEPVVPEPVAVREPVIVPKPVVTVDREPEPEPEPAKAAEPAADPDLSWRPTLEPHALERGGVMDAGMAPAPTIEDLVAGKLVWPNRSNLGAVPDLAWPSDTTRENPKESVPADSDLSWSADATPKPRVRVIESTPEPVPMTPVAPSAPTPPEPEMPEPAMPEPAMKAADPKVVIRPVEGAPERPGAVTARASRAARRSTMQKNHQQPRRKSSAQVAFAISLLGVLAVSIALVLAQSAGAVHLGFLGFAG